MALSHFKNNLFNNLSYKIKIFLILQQGFLMHVCSKNCCDNHQRHLAEAPWTIEQILISHYSTQPTLILLLYKHKYSLVKRPVHAPCSLPPSTQQGLGFTSKGHHFVPGYPTTGTRLKEKGRQKKLILKSKKWYKIKLNLH